MENEGETEKKVCERERVKQDKVRKERINRGGGRGNKRKKG